MKKIISVILAVLMLCTLFSVTAFAESTFESNLVINEEFVTSSNTSGQGWNYDHATTTLTLNGFNGKIKSHYEAATVLSDLHIVLVGENTVESGDDYFNLKYISNIFIEGTGSLTVTTPASKVTDTAASFTRLTVNSGTLNILTDRDVALHAEAKFTFNGGTLNLSAKKMAIITYIEGIEFAPGIELKDVKFKKYDTVLGEYVECSQAEAQMIEKEGPFVITNLAEIKVLDSKNTKWNPNSKDGVELRFDMDIKDFKKLVINKKEVDPQFYSLRSGSTIVTIKPEYLKTLGNGTYEVEAYSTNGVAKATFTVSGNLTSPKTGDSNNMGVWFLLLVASLGGMFVLMNSWKKANITK